MKHKTLISSTLIDHTILTHFPKKHSGKIKVTREKKTRRSTLLKICNFPKTPEAAAGSVP